MEKVKLGEIFEYLPKSKFKAGDGKEKGKYKFFTSSNVQNKFIDKFIYDGEYLIFGTGGKASINYCNDKFSTSTDNFVVKVNNEFNAKLIFLYFKNNMEILEKGFKGASIKHISKEYINQLEIPKYNCQHQINIVNKLDKVQDVIEMRKKQIEEFDELIKSQFVEMFGDIKNDSFDIISIRNLVNTNIVKTKKKYKANDVIKYIDISSIDNIKNEIISYTEYGIGTEPSRAQQCLLKGDILISTVRPNLRNIAVNNYDDDNMVGSSGFCILRPEKCKLEYLLEVVKTDKFTNDMVGVTTGANYPAIHSSDILDYEISVPPIELQSKFAEFAKQIDKQKFEVQKSLEEIQKLQESIMNKYFNGEVKNG